MAEVKRGFGFAPDGFMTDGTPIYIQTRPSAPPSSLQLKMYAAIADPSKKMSEEVLEWLKRSVEDR